MKMRMGWAILALAGAAMAEVPADPLLKPVAPDYAKRWLTAQAPVKVYDNTYLVGFGGLSVGLIKTSAGLVLIDGALPQAVLAVEANIRALGFDPKAIRTIFSTEPHYDHASGIAALQRDSGATVVASTLAGVELKAGHADAGDPQAPDLLTYPGVGKFRAMRDGETLRIGDVTITAHATPGHTLGSMSWSWKSCEGKDCKTVVFSASLNPTASDGFHFSEHRLYPEAFAKSFAKFRAMPCDILLSAHPDQSGGDKRYAALKAGTTPNPYVDSQACRAYADKFEALLSVKVNAGK